MCVTCAGAILIRVCPANECDTPAAFAAWALAQAAAVKPSATLLLPSLPSFPLSSFASVTGPLVTILPSLACVFPNTPILLPRCPYPLPPPPSPLLSHRYDDFVAYAQLETLAGVAPGAPEPVKALGQAYINSVLTLHALPRHTLTVVPTLALKHSLIHNYYMPEERVLVLETAWPGEERVLRGDRPVLPSSSSLIVALLFEPSGNAVSQRHQKSLLTQMLTGITRLLGEEVWFGQWGVSCWLVVGDGVGLCVFCANVSACMCYLCPGGDCAGVWQGYV